MHPLIHVKLPNLLWHFGQFSLPCVCLHTSTIQASGSMKRISLHRGSWFGTSTERSLLFVEFAPSCTLIFATSSDIRLALELCSFVAWTMADVVVIADGAVSGAASDMDVTRVWVMRLLLAATMRRHFLHRYTIGSGFDCVNAGSGFTKSIHDCGKIFAFLTLSAAKRMRYTLNFSWNGSIFHPILWNSLSCVMKPVFGRTNIRFAFTLKTENENKFVIFFKNWFESWMEIPFVCRGHWQFIFSHHVRNNNCSTSADTVVTEMKKSKNQSRFSNWQKCLLDWPMNQYRFTIG